jgi:hypothetical protein
MAVLSCEPEPRGGRAGGFSWNVGGNQPMSINRDIVESYLITTDNWLDSVVIVLSSPLVPQAFSGHKDFPSCLLTKASAEQDPKAPFQWHGLFTYTNIQPRTNDDNPLNRPDQVQWSNTPTKKVVYSAIRGQVVRADGTVIDSSTTAKPVPITNSALDPFPDGTLEDDDFDRVCTIQRNVSIVPSWVEDLEGAVNSVAVTLGGRSCDVATLRWLPADIGPLSRENDVYFYPVTMHIIRRKSGWDWLIADRGTQSYGLNGGTTKTPCICQGIPVTSPVNLDGGASNGFGRGSQLASTDPLQQVFITYQRPRGDFTQLRLPPR